MSRAFQPVIFSVEVIYLFEGKTIMASKDKPGAENRKHNPHHDEDVDAKHQERREKKHNLKVIRRRSRRTGRIPISSG